MKKLLPLLLSLMLLGAAPMTVFASQSDPSPEVEEQFSEDDQNTASDDSDDSEQYFDDDNSSDSDKGNDKNSNAVSTTVKTGDSTNVFPIIVVVIAAGSVAIYSGRKLLSK